MLHPDTFLASSAVRELPSASSLVIKEIPSKSKQVIYI